MAINRRGRRGKLLRRLAAVVICFALAILAVAVTQHAGRDRPSVPAGAAQAATAGARAVTAASSPSAGAGSASSSAASAKPTHRRLTPCERSLELARRMGTSFDIGDRRVDVLGDSYSVGTTLSEPRTQAWDVLMAQDLGWRLTVRGIGRTGFVNGGTCGGHDYQTRVEQVLADRPQLVVVQGGLNDVGYVDRVWQAASRLLWSIPTGIEVVVVGPPSAPAYRRSAEQRVDETLRSVVAATHGTYISTLDWPLSYAGDGIHLDAAGNKVFAQRLAAAIAAEA